MNGLDENWERSTSKWYIVTWLFSLDSEYIMQNFGLDESQADIKFEREISITSDMQIVPF